MGCPGGLGGAGEGEGGVGDGNRTRLAGGGPGTPIRSPSTEESWGGGWYMTAPVAAARARSADSRAPRMQLRSSTGG